MQQVREFVQGGKSVFRYLISTPPAYNLSPSSIPLGGESATTSSFATIATSTVSPKWPTILFLHGAGERSFDIEVIKKHGIPRLVQVYDNWKSGLVYKEDVAEDNALPPNVKLSSVHRSRKSDKSPPAAPIRLETAKFVAENFITVSPQLDPSQSYGWKTSLLEKLLDEVEQHYRVDKERLYVTGISMGGFGTFALAAANPHRFAAIVPICGGADPTSTALQLRNTPAWVFHGELDEIIPVAYSEEIVAALRNLKAEVKYTTYPEATHDSWTETYNNIEVYHWLLKHHTPFASAVDSNQK